MNSELMKPGKMVATAMVCILLGSDVQARVWRDTSNRAWEGEFVRIDGVSAVFMVGGKEYPFPLDRLSAADRVYINTLTANPAAARTGPAPAAATPPSAAPAAASQGMTFGGAELIPGKTVETELPLDAKTAKEMSAFYDKKPTARIKVAIAVPEGFDPRKPQRILFTSASSSGSGLSVPLMQKYAPSALARGWVVMAADGEHGRPRGDNDNIESRVTMLEVMLKELSARWPDAKRNWSVATAGASGGAGYASHQAVTMAAQDWRVIGMLLLIGSYSPAEWEKYVKGSKAKMRKVPVFYSGGLKDTMAKPEMLKATIETTKKGGYRRLRTEWHEGGHELPTEHVKVGLEWFESLEKEVNAER